MKLLEITMNFLVLSVLSFWGSISPNSDHSERHQYLKSLPHLLGLWLGMVLVLGLTGIGIQKISMQYPTGIPFLNGISALCVFYLTYQIARASWRVQHVDDPISKQQLWPWWKGVFFQIINPKAWMIALSAFSAESLRNYSISTWLLCAFACGVAMGLWLLVGKNLKKALNRSKQTYWLDYSVAFLLICAWGWGT